MREALQRLEGRAELGEALGGPGSLDARYEMVHEMIDAEIVPAGGARVWGATLAAMGGEYAAFACLAPTQEEQCHHELLGTDQRDAVLESILAPGGLFGDDDS